MNGVDVRPKAGMNCKSQNVIYVAQCKLCVTSNELETSYGGQTCQPLHKRVNGHRACFKSSDIKEIEKSALSKHSFEKHPDAFDLDNFKFLVHKQVQSINLNRQEAITIGSLRMGVLGLNRMKIQKD